MEKTTSSRRKPGSILILAFDSHGNGKMDPGFRRDDGKGFCPDDKAGFCRNGDRGPRRAGETG